MAKKKKDDKVYVVCRDGLYLMWTQEGAITEFVDGKLEKIPTCLYSADRRDAMGYDSRLKAHAVAKRIGGAVLIAEGRSWQPDEN